MSSFLLLSTGHCSNQMVLGYLPDSLESFLIGYPKISLTSLLNFWLSGLFRFYRTDRISV